MRQLPIQQSICCLRMKQYVKPLFSDIENKDGCYIVRGSKQYQKMLKSTETGESLKELAKQNNIYSAEAKQGDDDSEIHYNICLDQMDCRHIYSAITRTGYKSKISIINL